MNDDLRLADALVEGQRNKERHTTALVVAVAADGFADLDYGDGASLLRRVPADLDLDLSVGDVVRVLVRGYAWSVVARIPDAG